MSTSFRDPDGSPNIVPPWWEPPPHEVPAVLPSKAVVLGRTDHTAVFYSGAHVYTGGIELQIERRMRHLDMDDEEWNVLGQEFMERPYRQSEKEDRGLHYSLKFDDSSEFVALTRFRPKGDIDRPPIEYSVMRTRGGSQGDGATFASSEGLWIWPLPKGVSVVEMIFRWPAMQMVESRVQLELPDLVGASSRSFPLWE